MVAAHQHFGRAAADLHVAQPALSRQIQRLEKYLGARLLDRGPQGARLIPAGQSFLPRAQALLQAARQAELAVREPPDPAAEALQTSLPNCRGMSPVNGGVQDGSDAVITPVTA